MDVQSKINALWDTASSEYDQQPGHGFSTQEEEQAWKRALASLLPHAPCDVLDVGTGTGVIAAAVADLGHRVTGIDLADGMLAKARLKASAARAGSLRFQRADANDPALPAQSFDAVINRHVLWTITDPAGALRNWLALLRPEGRLIIIDGLWARDPDDRLDDAIASSLPLLDPAISVDDVVRIVTGAGFTSVASTTLDEVDRIEATTRKGRPAQPHYVIAARRPHATSS